MAFPFKKEVDPNEPFNHQKYPPPKDWELVSASDCNAALHGYPSELFTECQKWQQEELARKTQY